eukprot:GSMAST32.ASY1.ANO1.279.1 assembled CDS
MTLYTSIAVLLLTISIASAHVAVTGNPHMTSNDKKCDSSLHHTQQQSSCTAQVIELYSVVQTTLPVQSDTFNGIRRVKYMGTTVPIYLFKQPSRISPNELPFKILPILNLTSFEGIREYKVDYKMANDSWFPGYIWSIIICESGCNDQLHLGWKFTPKTMNNGAVPFYALIVDYTEDEKKQNGTGQIFNIDHLSIGTTVKSTLLALISLSTQKKQ